MANIKVRYLVTKPGRDGSRNFWQPAKSLRVAGWQPRRLSDDPLEAIGQAEELNKAVDAWRVVGGAIAGATGTGPAPGTVDALIAEYKGSDKYWGRLAPKSQKLYGFCLGVISKWAGDQPARAITAAMVDKLYEEIRASTPGKANVVIAVLRRLFNYGLRYGRLATNPAQQPGTIGLAFSGIIWPRAAVEAFVAKADALGMFGLGTAIRLNEWIGHNSVDVIALPVTAYRGGAIRLERSKTGRKVVLPVDLVAAVSDRLEADKRMRDAAGVAPLTLIARTKDGQQYSEATFANEFRALRDAVAADQAAFAVDGDEGETVATGSLQFRFLRHTAVTRLAEAGCEIPEIAAITGHSLRTVTQILEHYLDRTRALGAAAITKRLAKEGEG